MAGQYKDMGMNHEAIKQASDVAATTLSAVLALDIDSGWPS
jgi:hypothetical protein